MTDYVSITVFVISRNQKKHIFYTLLRFDDTIVP
jgi:hypothetical protein